MQENILFKQIPQELKFNALWCCWKYVPSIDKDTNEQVKDKNGVPQFIKKPFNVLTGHGAKSNDPSTFVGYPTLLNHIHKYLSYDESGKQRGGIGLGIFRGFSAIDIDHCIDENGVISEMAQDIINYCQSYTEYSPSKTGIRIIFKTNNKIDKDNYYINNHKLGLEIYISDNTNKFVTITGNKLSGDEIAELDIQYILDKYMKKGVFDIDKILEKDAKLKELWFATAPGSHADESERDAALCCKLAFYLKNDQLLIKQYFEESPYYKSKDTLHKKKWNGTYGLETIKGAVTLVGQTNYSQPVRIIKQYDLNDTGNSHRFVDMFGDIIRYNVDNKIWMIWNDKYWQSDYTESIKNYIEIMAESMQLESANIGDMTQKLRFIKNLEHIYSSGGKESLLKEARHLSGIPVFNSDFDNDDYLLCCENGVVDLRTGELKEPVKEDMISLSTGINVSYDEPVKFLKFFDEVFNGNENIKHYVHKALGYSISGLTREQCMFLIRGEGNNGKSLLLEVINCVLGAYGVTSKPQLITEQKFQTSNSEEIARLKGKRFNVVEETKPSDKADEQIIKQLTSGLGRMVARFLYAGSFEFINKTKIWMPSNYDLNILGTDKGIWRRIVKIPVCVDFDGREDKDLKDKLLTESSQILGWLIKGFQLYMKEGLEQPDEIKQAVKEYREDMDLVQQWINECCECKQSFYERANVLYDNFRAFCMRRDQRTNQTQFGRNLGKKFKKFNSGSGIVYIGLRLKHDANDLAKKVNYERLTIDDEDV